MVLRRGTQHRRAADVDLLDGLGDGHAVSGDGRFEGIEIDHDEIDRRDVEAFDVGSMGLLFAIEKNCAEDTRGEGLDAAAEDFGGAGPLGDRRDIDAVVGKMLGGAAGGEDLDILRPQCAGQIDDAGFVGDGEDRSLNLHAVCLAAGRCRRLLSR